MCWTFEKVRQATQLLLQNHLDFAPEEAEEEIMKLLLPAFESALDMAMFASPTVPVQPDWLIAVGAQQVWVMACAFGRNNLDYPRLPVHISIPDMYNDSVEPSPEHQARIEKRNANKATAARQQTNTIPQQPNAAQQRAERGANSVAETTTASFVLRWGMSLISDSWLVQGLQSSSSAARGDGSSGGEPVTPCTETGQEPHPDAREDPGCSTVGTPTDTLGMRPAETHAPEEVKQGADKKRTETIARVRQVISGFVKEKADSDPILNYRFDVSDGDFEAMSLLWYLTDVAERYPASESYPCTSKPWEVAVERSSAPFFFGSEFCHKAAILRCFNKLNGPAEIYAHFEGDFLYIGLTIPKDVVSTDLVDPTQTPLIVFSTIKKFNTLARWARNVEFGHRQSFVDWMDFTVRQDSINDMGAETAQG